MLDESTGRVVIDTGAPPLDGDRYTLTEVVKPPPAPALALLYPDTFVIGSPDTLLHAFGSGFDKGARIVIAGHVERTTWEDDTHLTTMINSAVWTNPDPAVPVLVRTGAGDTAPLTLAINAPA